MVFCHSEYSDIIISIGTLFLINQIQTLCGFH